MRNFFYFSEAKVNALHARIPPDFLRVGEALSSDRFGHALAVEQHLASQASLGNVGDRTEFFRGEHPMGYGVVEDYSQELVYFGAQIAAENTWVFLIGSRQHLLASADPETTGGRVDPKSSLTHAGLKAFNQLLRSEEAGDLQNALQGFDPQLVLGLRQGIALFPPAAAPLHYVAKTLHRVRTSTELFILAAPLFVSAVPEAGRKESGGGGWLGKLFRK